jgi:hypothetical protein
MHQKVKQAALTFGLALPLLVTVAISSPLTVTVAAQGVMHMVSPQFPILMDNGDGIPGPGDTSLLPTQTGPTTVQLPTLFSCGTQANNTVTLGAPDGAGRFQAAGRTNNARNQIVNVTGAIGAQATQFSFTEANATRTFATGTGSLIDMNGDGSADGMTISGSKGSIVLSFVFTSSNAYASIPAAQAALLGARQGRCGPAPAQFWVPLADTNGDARGDRVVLDLDGNGVPDPQYFTSPPIGAPAVPTMNTFGLALLTLLLGSIGVWYLGRPRLDVAGRA